MTQQLLKPSVLALVVFTISSFSNLQTTHGMPIDMDQLIATVKQVGPEGKGHEAAIAAMAELAKADATSIPVLLKGMNGANALATNWLRSAVESAAEKGELPLGKLKSFLQDKSNSVYPRRLAFELIVAARPAEKNAMLERMLEDPSLEIRRDAVALELSKVNKAESDEAKVAGFKNALKYARDIDQIQKIAESLDELGTEIDLVKHFGMIMDWQIIGPFENKDQARFNETYPPEKQIDLTATYTGMDDKEVSWKKYTSENDEGIVNLNEALSNHKGAIAYAYTEFHAEKDLPADVRIGCINAQKVWVNGKLVISNEVYHSGMNPDQYIGKTDLKKGKNTILIKVCQNEQTQPWAQRWEFQIRLSDATGKAIVDAGK